MTVSAMLFALSASLILTEGVGIYGDWAVGCDNARYCHAASLPVEEGPTEPLADGDLTIAIERDGAGPKPATVQLALNSEEVARRYRDVRWIAVDGRKLDIRLAYDRGVFSLNARNAQKLIAAMRGKTVVTLVDRMRQPIASASLRGLGEVLQYFDDRQLLSGTVVALARRGNKKVNPRTVPPMLAREQVRVAPKSAVPPQTVDEMQLARLRATDPCPSRPTDPPPTAPEYFRLDAGNSLMILPTNCGGYNPYSMLFVIDEKQGVSRPHFALPDGEAYDDDAGLPNVWWDENSRTLNSFGRGRVLADCGEIREYAWSDDRFMLVHLASMPVCRGSRDYITTYRADVVIDPNIQ